MQQPHSRDNALHKAIKEVLLKIQREGQSLKQMASQLHGLTVVRHRRLLELINIRHRLRPHIRPAVEPLVHKVRVRLVEVLADVETLLELGVGALLENLRAKDLVATVPAVEGLADELLVVGRELEEALALGHDAGLEGSVNGVALDLEEAIVEAAFADLVDDGLLLGRVF